MFKAIKKFFQRKQANSEQSVANTQALINESPTHSTTEETIKPKKGRTVLVFDTKTRVFVVKKRVARIALYNPSTQTVLFKNKEGEERALSIPLEKGQSALPLSGCWFDKEACNIGFYLPGLEYFYLVQDKTLKPIRIDAKQFKGVGDYDKMLPLSGFWFDPEIETIGLYDPSSALFLLKHQDESNKGSVFQYGPFKNHMQPLVGDWYGQGIDSVGLYDADSGVFFLKGTLEGSDKQDINFHFGPPKSEMIALSGDWNGTGVDKIGLYSSKDGLFFLMHANKGAEQADVSCYFGPAGKSQIPLVGDWAGEGQDGLAIYDPQVGIAYLKNNCVSGDADMAIQFSVFEPESIPLVVYELI
ncbi:MAG: hypothetical protein K9L22_04270 [Methylococcaceae bacterium]|nr:hypothetical protein [Methylococcaceae bacterium]